MKGDFTMNYIFHTQHTVSDEQFRKIADKLNDVINEFLKEEGFDVYQMTSYENFQVYLKLHNEILERAKSTLV